MRSRCCLCVCVRESIPLSLLRNSSKKSPYSCYATATFSMQSMSYQRKVGDSFFPELLVYFTCFSRLGQHQVNYFTFTLNFFLLIFPLHWPMFTFWGEGHMIYVYYYPVNTILVQTHCMFACTMYTCFGLLRPSSGT
jgi:hypothetical protein